MNLVKLPFLLINLVFLILSLALIGFGIYVLTDETIIDRVISLSNLTEILKLSPTGHHNDQPFKDDADQKNKSTSDDDGFLHLHGFTDPISFLLIFIGGLLFILSFIGYCGAIKDSRCLVALFGVVLGLVFVAEVGGVCLYFFLFKPDIKSYLTEGIKSHYNPDPHPTGPGTRLTVIMDYLMIEHNCCGINSDADFAPVYDRRHLSHQQIPEACCRLNITNFREVNQIYESILMSSNTKADEINPNFIRNRGELLEFADDPNCISGQRTTDSAYLGEENGCFNKISTDWGTFIIIFGVVLAILQLSGVAFSVFVFRAAYYDFHS